MLLLWAGAKHRPEEGFFLPELDFGPNIVPIGTGLISQRERAFFGPSGSVYRRVDVFNADGTPFALDAPVLEGSVSVDMGRDERRTFDLVLDSEDGAFRSDPTGFWYDKTVKIYRGVTDAAGQHYYFQLGEFLVDSIDEPHFPPQVSVAGRDLTKRMMQSSFAAATAFTATDSVELTVAALAANSGIHRRNLPTTGEVLGREFFFEAGFSRWEAAKQIAGAFRYELYFDNRGTLVMRPFTDPTTAPLQFTFLTGGEGNMASFSLSTNDSRVFNDVVVTGTAANQLPVYGHAENTEPTSPTRIARLGRRTYHFDSQFVATTNQANALALSLLRVMALESYELSVDALVAPWLEPGTTVEFLDPDPAFFTPTRFLLASFDIPLGLGTMSVSARRVTIVD